MLRLRGNTMVKALWTFFLLLAWVACSSAADFPTKPLRLIVPYPPGGLLDNVGRALAPGLGAQLGQPVVVENRPGAAGMIGPGVSPETTVRREAMEEMRQTQAVTLAALSNLQATLIRWIIFTGLVLILVLKLI